MDIHRFWLGGMAEMNTKPETNLSSSGFVWQSSLVVTLFCMNSRNSVHYSLYGREDLWGDIAYRWWNCLFAAVWISRIFYFLWKFCFILAFREVTIKRILQYIWIQSYQAYCRVVLHSKAFSTCNHAAVDLLFFHTTTEKKWTTDLTILKKSRNEN